MRTVRLYIKIIRQVNVQISKKYMSDPDRQEEEAVLLSDGVRMEHS